MTIDLILIALAFLLILIGCVGSFLPVLPGPPLAYAGMIAAYYSQYKPFGMGMMITYAIVVVLISLIDYMLPAWATKLTGGTASGARGALIGTIAGMFIPIPFGIFLGAFLGAFIGELYAGKNQQQAAMAALASFAGFVAGAFMKLILCLMMGLHLLINLIW